MRPINIYFAGAWPNITIDEKILPTKRLVSYAYPSDLDKWLQVSVNSTGSVIIDSGAFSAWNKGTIININDYINYCHEAIEKIKNDGKIPLIVNLDVIPGVVNKTKDLTNKLVSEKQLQKNKDTIDEAAKKGYENLKYFIQNGITPIHVFHQGEDWEWLDKMLELTDYIGISPANDMPQAAKMNWMYSVFEYLYKKGSTASTHGFAVTSIKAMKRLPWTSCDSASWKLQAAFGSISYPIGGFSKKHKILSNKDFTSLSVSEQSGGNMIGKTIKKMLLQDGYDWDNLQKDTCRYEINLRFMHKLETDLNEFKKSNEFSPIKTLI